MKPPKDAATWFASTDNQMDGQIVLVTSDPARDQAGTPARWYRRRRHVGGQWQTVAQWVDPIHRMPLDPQPTHWRHDPARVSLEVPVA